MSDGYMLPVKGAAAVLSGLLSRVWRLPPKRNRVQVARNLPVLMRDGVVLLVDHHAPVNGQSQPTILIRTPYGRGTLHRAWLALPYAERGYHVVLQSTRGTHGSGGTWDPFRHEAEDGQDTMAWLREQPWFDGRLAAIGVSYLGYGALSLATDPPPELKAMAIAAAPHDLHATTYGTGTFRLRDMLGWSEILASQEEIGLLRLLIRAVRSETRLAPAMNELPLTRSAQAAGGGAAPWYPQWLAHPGRAHPYWDDRTAVQALARAEVPVLLTGGFHDFFLDQTLAQYHALRDRNTTVALTLGPWTHMSLDQRIIVPETLAWLDHHLAGDGPAPREQPVRLWNTGTKTWHFLNEWPPSHATTHTLYLHTGGHLKPHRPDSTTGSFTPFLHDPGHPTPSVGGRILAFGAGSKDNKGIEARADVLTFTTDPLTQPLTATGNATTAIYAASDNPHADLFVRLCDVDPQGRSYNLTDQIVRPPAASPGEIRTLHIPLPGLSHTFRTGHRVRLQVSAAAHPRFARNPGTPGPAEQATTTAPATWKIHHTAEHASALTLPTTPVATESDGFKSLREGQAVSYVPERGAKGMQAAQGPARVVLPDRPDNASGLADPPREGGQQGPRP
ncbi:CocE/NonD family hydrolase [Streptomyces sp. NBC_00435]|uniref:CocE/NonD family hydrolase n=1 Tax=Streptomyces sp. NBC_00435 TaxID=2903649 RepID=UPI002E1D3646